MPHQKTRALTLLLTLLLCAAGARAQDERRVTSPDGQIEFRIFLIHPEPEETVRLAYQVYYHGQRFINTSFLGLDIHDQPLLGQNVGMIGAKTESASGYHALTAEYMQNGSLGRRINVEVRAYNDGIAFRYVVPKSGPLVRMSLDNETTEFEFMEDATLDRGHQPVTQLSTKAEVALPVVAEQPGLGWISIGEVRMGSYPRMYLIRTEGKILISRLPPGANELHLAWEGATPMTCPWRVLTIGATRAAVVESKLASGLP